MKREPTTNYEVCVRGILGPTMAAAFPGLTARHVDGETILSGPLRDQAELYGVLYQIESLGVQLVEVRRRPEAPLPVETSVQSGTQLGAMRALALRDFGVAPTVQELGVPHVGPGLVRVRVKAASLNRIDVMIAAGKIAGLMDYRFPAVLGRDASGVVDALGAGVDHVTVGQEVIAHVPMTGPLGSGTLAAYAVVPDENLIAKPLGLDFAAAAALPLAGGAALASIDAVSACSGMHCLIIGASGGVGSYAVQLAAARGATVIATALPDDTNRLRGLGATDVVDYRHDIVSQVHSQHPGGVDALIDLVSPDEMSLGRVASLVRDGGRVASTLGAAGGHALEERGIVATNIRAIPNRAMLQRLVSELESGSLRVDVGDILSLDEATIGLDHPR